MDVCIKNINDEDWLAFKSESAKHGMKMGEFFSKMVDEHKDMCNKSNWKNLLHGEKTLSDDDVKNIKKAMKGFRKGFDFRKL
ncbi:MAG: hypothetical protein Q7J54_06970 [Candidatus Woesearchaeota archaeon]|nr:hypothetical protein [Candidatus Woesearchaeota archaeon]